MTRYRGARDGGFALLIVLWTVVLISFLLTGLASSSRLEAQVTVNLRSAAELEAEADGAIATTIFALLQPARGPATGIPGVDVLSLSGLLNPNVVTAELMRALLIRLGTDARQADALAAAIVDWRSPGRAARPGGAKAAQYRAAGRAYGPPGAPFETLAELQDVLGMTPGILAALQPHLTLYWDGDPDPMTAGPLMQAALRDVKAAPGTGVQLGRASHDVVRITAAAAHADGTRVVRRAVIRIGPSGNRRGWRVLTWETAAG